MSKVLCEKSDLVAIADSVRSKTGTTEGMKVAEIPQKIDAIETGTTSVPSIISGTVAEVIPVAYECLKKAQTSDDNTYRKFLKYGVPVFLYINVQGSPFISWGPLRFSNGDPKSNSLIWQSRVFSKRETGLANDVFFGVTFRIKDGVVNTENYTTADVFPNIHSLDGVSPKLAKSPCATISDWLN